MKKRLGKKWDIEIISALKIGGPVEGISCRFEGDNRAVVVYPGDYQSLMKYGMTAKDIGKYLARKAEEGRKEVPDLPKTVEEFREGLYVKVVNSEVNQELLKNTVHDAWDDIAAVAYCRISMEGKENISFLVTKDNMSSFEMTQNEIMEKAYRNTSEQKFCIKNMNDILWEFIPSQRMPEEMMEDIRQNIESPFFVLTNEEMLNGANAIVCPKVLARAYEQLGEPYYILPSSTHEVILVKESAGLSTAAMKEMVREVNTETVLPKELLSFNVFRYDGRKLSAIKEDAQETTKTAEKIMEKTGKLTR